MAAKSYRTNKGTELPLLNLRGKQYLEVKYRLVWFREDHPDWSIETELLNVTEDSAYARATIKDQHGRIIATSHKFESLMGFPDFMEKSETGAIGRALALIGYGTQFCADELDEGQRIVDAPADVPRRKSEKSLDVENKESRDSESSRETQNSENPQPIDTKPGDYLINFGRKYKGKKLKDIPKKDLESYLEWLENGAVKPGTPLSAQVRYLKTAFDQFYQNESQNHSTQ